MKHRFDKIRAEIEVMRLVWRSASGQHAKLSIAMVIEMLIGLFPPFAIYLLQKAIGMQATNVEALFTRENIVFLLVVYFFYIVLIKLSRVLMAYAVAEVEYNLRKAFVDAMKNMPYSVVAGKIGLQSSNGLTQEISMASGLVPMVYRSFFRAASTIAAFCVILLVISPHFFVVVFLLTIAVLLSVTVLRSRIKRIHQELYNRISSLYQLFGEWIGGYRVFRVYNSMDFAVQRMHDVFLNIRYISRRLSLVANSQGVLAEMLTYCVAAVIIVMMPTTDGVVDLGVLVSFPTAILFIRSESMVLINGYQQLANTESSIKRLFKMIHEAEIATGEIPEVGCVQRISFDGVSYAYESESSIHEILKNASLHLDGGLLHVITGPSGTGKTTTLNLLLGLLHPQEGCITFITSDSSPCRHGLALVEQEPFIFDGTLYDNLCMGRKGIATTDMMHYLAELRMTHLFPTEESLREPSEMFSWKLSSGEKQRLALVRALIGRPAVLVADEPTSNIDQDTSMLMINCMKALSEEMLVIVVSHDPALIRQADMVHTLKDKAFVSTPTSDHQQ